MELIDNTTNWYIRFNRRRLKGEYGIDDTIHALNTLFEVLFTLCRGLAPFTPFITDTIYQRLLPHIPEDMRAEDPRSVHFLAFPDVRQELFDAEIERRVGRMQRVIELARVSRERRTIGLKTPLKTLVVLHPDQQYLDDVKTLENYIVEELNVRDLVLTSDEERYNVQYSVTADWPVLGKKLKKDMAKVKKALPGVTSEQVKQYTQDKFIVLDGIRLEAGDLVVRRDLDRGASAADSLEVNTDEEVLTILDTALYPELAQEGVAREIISRVQRLRKKAGLAPTDDVRMQYRVLADPDGVGLEAVFAAQAAAMERALRRPLEGQSQTPDGAKQEEGVIAEEEQEVQKATFMLRLLKL